MAAIFTRVCYDFFSSMKPALGRYLSWKSDPTFDQKVIKDTKWSGKGVEQKLEENLSANSSLPTMWDFSMLHLMPGEWERQYLSIKRVIWLRTVSHLKQKYTIRCLAHRFALCPSTGFSGSAASHRHPNSYPRELEGAWWLCQHVHQGCSWSTIQVSDQILLFGSTYSPSWYMLLGSGDL